MFAHKNSLSTKSAVVELEKVQCITKMRRFSFKVKVVQSALEPPKGAALNLKVNLQQQLATGWEILIFP